MRKTRHPRPRRALALSLLLGLSLALAAQGALAKSIALVIGNAAYAELETLHKTHDDAEGYERLLKAKGFTVYGHRDLDMRATAVALGRFIALIEPGDTVAFVFSGHGWSSANVNYLIPVDAPRSGGENLLRNISLPLMNGETGVLDQIARTKALRQLAIIDACRDNPFAEGLFKSGNSRGLAPVQPPGGSFVVYSAGANEKALDRLHDGDPERYSVFSRSFIPLLEQDLSLLDAIKAAQSEVWALAGRASPPQTQIPAYYENMLGDFCLTGSCRPRISTPADPCSIAQAPEGFLCVPKGGRATFEALASRPAAEPALPPVVAAPQAEADRQTLCEEAVDPADPDRLSSVKGLDWDLLRPERHLAACEAMTRAAPEGRRFWTILGRLQAKSGDGAAAMASYGRAAELGSSMALAEMGRILSFGLYGVPADREQSLASLRKASQAGNARGAYALGNYYYAFKGGLLDRVETSSLYQKAAEAGDQDAMLRLGLLYKSGDILSANPEKALEWYRKALDAGSIHAASYIAYLHKEGVGVPQDHARAAEFFRQSAEAGSGFGMSNLGWAYKEGEGVAQSDAQALEWFRRSAEAGDARGMNALALMYEEGRGVARDLATARLWYERAIPVAYPYDRDQAQKSLVRLNGG